MIDNERLQELRAKAARLTPTVSIKTESLRALIGALTESRATSEESSVVRPDGWECEVCGQPDIHDVQAELTAARELAFDLEFSGTVEESSRHGVCPECEGWKKHEKSCELGQRFAALAGKGE